MTRQGHASPGAAYDLGYHVVWCPKYARSVLSGRAKDRREELICATAGEHGCQIAALDVMPDKVHLFVTPNPNNSPSYVASKVTSFTAHHPRGGFPRPRSPLPIPWSRSCFVARVVATAGAVPVETVQR
ncbi:IS200/IS605 family transposase [Microbispora amethystogenes]|uniref:IS200/IS605 family transposase n=1 Tax=Microbispora amethystogenes TaxID=1427754 RepID=UPI0033DA7480